MRKAIVTGGSRGIGHAIVEIFEQQGYSVIAPTREELDLSNNESISSFIEKDGIKEADILVNNAAENILGTIEILPPQTLARMMQVNFFAPWMLISQIAPCMAERGFGRIINISSVYGIRARSMRGAYTSSKSALIGLTKTAAVEYGSSGVLINSVAPGFIDTELTRTNNSAEDLLKITNQIPLKRLALPTEIANFVAWLCSENNTYITGQDIAIDGGFLIS